MILIGFSAVRRLSTRKGRNSREVETWVDTFAVMGATRIAAAAAHAADTVSNKPLHQAAHINEHLDNQMAIIMARAVTSMERAR